MKIEGLLEGFRLLLGTLLFIAFAIMGVIVIGRTLLDISPAITVMFFYFGTILSAENRNTRATTLGGIAIYALSWFLVPGYGAIIASVGCATGVCLWFWGFFKSIEIAPS